MEMYVKYKGHKEKFVTKGISNNTRLDVINQLKYLKKEDCIVILKDNGDFIREYYVYRKFIKECNEFNNLDCCNEIIEKNFHTLVKDCKGETHDISISRADYEYMPDSMVAFNWSDRKMKKLSKAISLKVLEYIEKDRFDDDNYFAVIEDCAIDMGMKYYEDYLTNEELKEIDKEQ